MPPPLRPLTAFLIASFLLAPALDTLGADDFKALSGKVFRQAEVTTLSETTVTLRHLDGTTVIPLSDFSDPDQHRLRDLEIRRRSAEIRELQRELERRQAELDSLRRTQDRLQSKTLPPTVPASPASSPLTTPPATPSPPPATPEPQIAIAVRELVQAFCADLPAADARFRGKRFRIRGIVQGFQSKAFLRNYSVQLDSGDPKVRVVARFSYRSDWKAVYPDDDGRRLVARLGEQQRTLLQNGDEAICLGTCEGLKDGDIIFSGCTQESPALPPKSSSRL